MFLAFLRSNRLSRFVVAWRTRSTGFLKTFLDFLSTVHSRYAPGLLAILLAFLAFAVCYFSGAQSFTSANSGNSTLQDLRRAVGTGLVCSGSRSRLLEVGLVHCFFVNCGTIGRFDYIEKSTTRTDSSRNSNTLPLYSKRQSSPVSARRISSLSMTGRLRAAFALYERVAAVGTVSAAVAVSQPFSSDERFEEVLLATLQRFVARIDAHFIDFLFSPPIVPSSVSVCSPAVLEASAGSDAPIVSLVASDAFPLVVAAQAVSPPSRMLPCEAVQFIDKLQVPWHYRSLVPAFSLFHQCFFALPFGSGSCCLAYFLSGLVNGSHSA